MFRFNCEIDPGLSPRPLCSPEGSPDTRPLDVLDAAHRLGLQMAKQSFSEKAPHSDGSALTKLRDELLVGGRLDLASLSLQLARLATRSRHLGFDQKTPLFAFPRVGLPGEDEDDRSRSYVVPKPLDSAKAVLADQYWQKYGIRIVPVLLPRRNEDNLLCVLRHLSAAKGQPVGFLLRVITDHRYKPVLDYEGHVIPLVIQEGDSRMDIVNLNSLGEFDKSYKEFLHNIRRVHDCLPGARIQTATLRSQRQGDFESCHTDAIQVLKDALLAFKASGQSSFFTQIGADAKVNNSDVDEPRFSLPSGLQKTTQRSMALREDGVDMTVQVGRKGESLQSHREKYSGSFQLGQRVHSAAQKKVVNHFLTIKAYRNADRVLSVLEGMTPFERNRYLRTLRQQW